MNDILILGGGFAGMMAALNAADENARASGDIAITVVSPSPYITIRPRLYEKDPESLRAPLLPTFDPVGVSFVEAAARTIDTEGRTVSVAGSDGAARTLNYDRLVLATGSELRPIPLPGLAEHSFNIDTWEAAIALDKHLKKLVHNIDIKGRNTFVIIGAGMSGIEIAAEMRNRLANHGEAQFAAGARVILAERAEVVGPEFGAEPRPVIEDGLREAEVEIRLGVEVSRIEADAVTFDGGERIEAATTIVTTGLQASPLTAQIPAVRDELGRLPVDDMLRVVGVPGVYATGDVARAVAADGHYALMSCQHSRTMGKYAGYNAARDLLGLKPRVYRQTDYTTCLDLGNFGAVFSTGWDRRVQHFGEKAKKRKMWINGELIYPPLGSREDILAAGRIDPETGR